VSGPYYWNKSAGWFPVQSGSPVLIDQQTFEDCCCVTFSQTWSFTDTGFIDGGQDGAYRAYDDPGDVPASPWTILNDGLSLRLDWEDDQNCMGHNPYTQYATATCEIIVPRALVMTVTWSGEGETQDPNYELMSLYVGGNLRPARLRGRHGPGRVQSRAAAAGHAPAGHAHAVHRRHDERPALPLRRVVSVRPDLRSSPVRKDAPCRKH